MINSIEINEAILLSAKPNKIIANILGKSVRSIQRKRKENSLENYIAEYLNNNGSDKIQRQMNDKMATKERHDSDILSDNTGDKISLLENEIKELKTLVNASNSLIVELVKIMQNGDKTVANSDILSDIATKKEGGLGGVSLSSLESISLIDIEDSKEKKYKKKKSDNDNSDIVTTTTSDKKTKTRSVLAFQDDRDKQAFEYFCNNYPESARASKPEVCARHWHRLTQQQKQEALDKIPLIQENFKNTEPLYIDKLSNMLHGRRWEQITERTVQLKNAKGNKSNKVDKDMLREIFNDQMGIY